MDKILHYLSILIAVALASPPTFIGGLPFEEQIAMTASSYTPIIGSTMALEATNTVQTIVATSSATTTAQIQKPKPKPRPYNCSCVTFARQHSPFGNFLPITSAKQIPILLYQPIIGAVAVFGTGGSYHSVHGHAAVVLSIDGDYMRVKEWNLKPCAYSERTIAWRGADKDPYLLGFFARESY